ncbi:hypothetical protein PENTCL1PPCAC_264, partial [Pristionchus entomophagus]
LLLVPRGFSAMGCTVSKKKQPIPPADGAGKPPESAKSNKMEPSDKNSSSSKSGKGTNERKNEESVKPGTTHTDISKLVTEKVVEQSEKKQKTLEEKTAKMPSAYMEHTDDDKMTTEKTPLPCATPLKSGQKLQSPKPDNGEYINFNDLPSDEEFSEAEDKDGKKKEQKDDSKKREKKDGKKEAKAKEKEGKK